jgi:hypothetical protein
MSKNVSKFAVLFLDQPGGGVTWNLKKKKKKKKKKNNKQTNIATV